MHIDHYRQPGGKYQSPDGRIHENAFQFLHAHVLGFGAEMNPYTVLLYVHTVLSLVLETERLHASEHEPLAVALHRTRCEQTLGAGELFTRHVLLSKGLICCKASPWGAHLTPQGRELLEDLEKLLFVPVDSYPPSHDSQSSPLVSEPESHASHV